MTLTRWLAGVLDASLARNSRLIGLDEEEAPVAKPPAAFIVALSLIGVTLAIASMIWFLSRELAVTYAKAFRKASFPRE